MQFQDFTFGVEIECYIPGSLSALFASLQNAGVNMSHAAGSIHRVTSGWKVVGDGSLHSAPVGHVGCEVVSPILRGEDGIAQTIKVMEAVKAFGGKVNKSCGLHVHVGAQDATAGQLKNLAKMFIKYEHHMDALCPESRRNGNRYCQSNRAQAAGYGVATTYEAQVASAFDKLDGLRSVAAIAKVMNGGYAVGQHYTHHRYFKLNFQSMASHGTVEFRQQAGTVEGQKAAAWIRLVVGLVASSFSLKSVTTQREPSFDKLVRKVDRTTAEYLKARRVALNRGGALVD
jgi:hypothetical protein